MGSDSQLAARPINSVN